MPPLTSILPPEAQPLLGGIALLTAVFGLILATTGIKIARLLITLLLGFTAAALAAWLVPTAIDISPVTAALIGFALGALTGALAFRLLQGLTLALCLALAAGTLYYTANIQPTLPTPVATATAPHTDTLHLAAATLHSLTARWSAIPKTHQKRLLIVTISAAAIALLIAFAFPRPTTWIITSLIGSLLLLLGSQTLLHLYTPQLDPWFPTQPRPAALTLSLLTLTTLLIQHTLCWPRKPRPTPPPPTPVPAIPQTAPASPNA